MRHHAKAPTYFACGVEHLQYVQKNWCTLYFSVNRMLPELAEDQVRIAEGPKSSARDANPIFQF